MGRLKCGHNDTWTMRLVDRGIRYAFCIGCLVEATGIKDINGRDVINMKQNQESTVEKQVIVKTPDKKKEDAKVN